MPEVDRNLDLALAAVGVFGGALLAYLGETVTSRYVTYIGICGVLGSVLYIDYRIEDELTLPSVSERQRKFGDIVFLIFIVGMVAVSMASPGVPTIFHVLLAASSFIALLRIVFAPSLTAVVYLCLLAIVIRSAIWFSAPVIGTDSRLHLGITRYIVEHGQRIIQPAFQYEHYPISHHSGAVSTIVTGVPVEQGFFIGVTIPVALSLVAVVALTQHLSTNATSLRSGLLAVFFLTVSPTIVGRTGLPHAQSLELVFIPFLLLVLGLADARRMIILFLAFLLPLIFTHKISSAVLAIILACLLIIGRAAAVAHRRGYINEFTAPLNSRATSIALVAIIGITTVEFWHQIDYFDTQISRVLTVYFATGGAGQQIEESAVGATGIGLADPVLHIGSDLFVIAVFLVVGVCWTLYRALHDDLDFATAVWLPAGVVLFGFVGLSLVVGGTNRVRRIAPAILIFIVPIVGIVADRLSTRRMAVVGVCLLLLSFPLLSVLAVENGYRNDMVSPTERAVDDFPAHMTDSEFAALIFGMNRANQAQSDNYAASTADFQKVGEQSNIIDLGHQRKLTEDDIRKCDTPTLYFEKFKRLPGIKPSEKMDQLYSSGTGGIYYCGT